MCHARSTSVCLPRVDRLFSNWLTKCAVQVPHPVMLIKSLVLKHNQLKTRFCGIFSLPPQPRQSLSMAPPPPLRYQGMGLIKSDSVQGYLAHKKMPTPPGSPREPRHSPTVGSYGLAVSYARYPCMAFWDCHLKEQHVQQKKTQP